jgi:hypothetical protein
MVSRFQNQQVCVSMLKFDRWIAIAHLRHPRLQCFGKPRKIVDCRVCQAHIIREFLP